MANGTQTSWGAGEYAQMAERLELVSRELVELAGVTSRDDVLDLGCGTGNAALIAAARGAHAVGVDFEPTVLQIARVRCGRADLDVEFMHADLASAPVRADGFSVVLSAFGVMYASDQDAAAATLAHACAAGGRIALAAWTPESFMTAMGAVLAPYLPPPPPDTGISSRWGAADAVTELLNRHRIRICSTRTRSLALRFTDRRQAIDFLTCTAGHVVMERPRLEREQRWEQLEEDLERLVVSRDDGAPACVELPCEYLLVVGSRR